MKISFNKISLRPLRILITLAAIIYAIIFVEEITPPFYESGLGVAMVYVLFAFFLLGYFYLWKNEKISGLILVVWYGLLWVVGIWIWTNAGMVLGLGIPIPILGAILLARHYSKDIKRFFQNLYK